MKPRVTRIALQPTNQPIFVKATQHPLLSIFLSLTFPFINFNLLSALFQFFTSFGVGFFLSIIQMLHNWMVVYSISLVLFGTFSTAPNEKRQLSVFYKVFWIIQNHIIVTVYMFNLDLASRSQRFESSILTRC